MLQQRPAHIIAIPSSALVGVNRTHPVSGIIEDQAFEQRAGWPVSPAHFTATISGEYLLNLIPKFGPDDRLMLARIALLLVNDLAQVNAILQDAIEMAAAERFAAGAPARSAGKELGAI